MNHLVELEVCHMTNLELNMMGLVPKMMDQKMVHRTMNLELNFLKKKEKGRNDQKKIFLQRFSLVCEFSFLFENQFIFIAEMELICQRKNFL